MTPRRRRARRDESQLLLCLLVLVLDRAADLARRCTIQYHDRRLVELALMLNAVAGDTAELADRLLTAADGGAQ
jgi:hypothetical protein